MIKLLVKYDENKDGCYVKSKAKHTHTLEYLCAISYLIDLILANDEDMTYKDIIKISNKNFKEEGKNNGK